MFNFELEDNKNINKIVVIIENVFRMLCILFMSINIPYTYIGYYFNNGETIHLIIVIILVVIYILGDFIKNDYQKIIVLAGVPSLIFIISGILTCSILLIISSVIFSIIHIYISVKNYKYSKIKEYESYEAPF